ncbi:MAG: TIGR03643 family protein [Saprospiraceae bacterium]|nr:TIGR03643 family protein [Saprospiraceae bacterium]
MNIIDKYDLSPEDVDRIIGMAWEDRTPFGAITHQFGLSEQEVIRLMRQQLKLKSWKRWRARVQGRKTKHRQLRKDGVSRFRSQAQKIISQNRPSKGK